MYLTRIEPQANMRRFYLIDITPDLFGGVTLVRNWGRIGSTGTEHRQWFAVAADAEAARHHWHDLKAKRGYIAASP